MRVEEELVLDDLLANLSAHTVPVDRDERDMTRTTRAIGKERLDLVAAT
ncbi:hypothetical protein ABZV14_33140 [Streptosporangium canum]